MDSPSSSLRGYQLAAADSIMSGFGEFRRQLVVMPTGSGKTVLFAETALQFQPGRTLVLAHREELIDQAVDKIAKFTGLKAEVEMGQRKASLDAPIVVASVQTLQRQARRDRWPKHHFSLVVVDEAHHVLAASYLRVLNHFDAHSSVLGVTATPDRADKRQLAEYFENIAYEIGLIDLVKQAWLSPIRVRTVPLGLDLRGVRTVAGDYNAEDLGNIVGPQLGKIVEVLAREYSHRKTIVFLPLISLSQTFTRLCQDAGLRAWHVDGSSKDRAEILSEFSAARSGIISNAMLLTEGYDEPSIDCVVCLRPTKIRSLYCQIVGRGTRVYPNKDHLLLLDFLWLSDEHSLIKPAHLVAKDEDEAKELTEMLVSNEELEGACEDVAQDRTRKLSERLDNNRTRRARFFDPLEYAVSLGDLQLAEFEPTMGWHSDAPTARQLQVLGRFGFDARQVTCKGHAAAILDRIFMRGQLKLATPKQLRWLTKLGHPDPQLATFDEAKLFLDEKFSKRSPAATVAA
jgi:superfamily II DNA or RNA helicase